MLSNSFCQGKFLAAFNLSDKNSSFSFTGAKLVSLELVCLPCEDAAFSVKPKQLNPVSDLAEGRGHERMTEMGAVTIVKFHDSPILQLPCCSLYQ